MRVTFSNGIRYHSFPTTTLRIIFGIQYAAYVITNHLHKFSEHSAVTLYNMAHEVPLAWAKKVVENGTRLFPAVALLESGASEEWYQRARKIIYQRFYHKEWL